MLRRWLLGKPIRQGSSAMADGIRWATEDDKAAIAALWHRVWMSTYAQHMPTEVLRHLDLAFFEQRTACSLFERNASLPTASCDVRPTALMSQGARGDLSAFAVVRGGAEVEQLYVLPGAHGSGVAASILGTAEGILMERGCDVAHLVVAVRNLRARRFYEKHGWLETDRQPWMSTAPWEPVPCGAPPKSQDAGCRSRDPENSALSPGALATTMRCMTLKKFLGYDQGEVPRMTSY